MEVDLRDSHLVGWCTIECGQGGERGVGGGSRTEILDTCMQTHTHTHTHTHTLTTSLQWLAE